MDGFFFNKLAGWLLFTALMFFGLNILADIVYHAEQPERKGLLIEVEDAAAPEPAASVEDVTEAPVGERLGDADIARGMKLYGKCKACHDPSPVGKSKVGPPLYEIVGRDIASLAGFSYSKSLADRSDEVWTYENLDAFLKAPKVFAPKTKMAFKGLDKPDDRADMIAYLRSLSAQPQPLPGE